MGKARCESHTGGAEQISSQVTRASFESVGDKSCGLGRRALRPSVASQAASSAPFWPSAGGQSSKQPSNGPQWGGKEQSAMRGTWAIGGQVLLRELWGELGTSIFIPAAVVSEHRRQQRKEGLLTNGGTAGQLYGQIKRDTDLSTWTEIKLQ